MPDDWEAILEDREVGITDELDSSSVPRVDVEAPPSFGRSEYRKMIEDLWSEDDLERKTSLDRSIEAVSEASMLTVNSVQKVYETTVSGEFDPEQYGVSALGLIVGSIGVVGSPALSAMEWTDKAISTNLQTPLNNSSDIIYDPEADIGEQEVARIFYNENSSGRYVRFTGDLGESPDREVVAQGLKYLENFEA